MTEIPQLVSECISLDRDILVATETIKTMKKELAEKEQLLIEQAKASRSAWVAGKGGSHHVNFASTDGEMARVTFGGPGLLKRVEPGKLIEKIKTLCGRKFSDLFKEKIEFETVNELRTVANALLGEKDAQKLFGLIEKAGSTSVSYETKQSVGTIE